MDTDCKVIGELLVESAGASTGLTPEQLAHLEACPSCSALANAERTLDQLLETAVPPEDLALQRQVKATISPVGLRSRFVAFLPVAASLIVAWVGVAMIGGVPGGSLLARVPLWSSQGWLALIGGASDLVVALAATARSAQLSLPPLVQTAAVLMAILGSSVVILVTRRWRAHSPWRRNG